MATSKLILKLVIDPKVNKVILAEAGKDFVDFLLSLLALPLGAVINLLTEPPIFGSIGNVHKSLENLNTAYLQPRINKDLLLKPCLPIHAKNVPLLLPDTAPPEPVQLKLVLYGCSNKFGCYVTDCPNKLCGSCGGLTNKKVKYFGLRSKFDPTSQAGYVKGGIDKYMVLDDLSVLPITSIVSSMNLLNKLNVEDLGALQEKIVEVGVNEGLALLKASLQSKEALTSVFLIKQEEAEDTAASD